MGATHDVGGPQGHTPMRISTTMASLVVGRGTVEHEVHSQQGPNVTARRRILRVPLSALPINRRHVM